MMFLLRTAFWLMIIILLLPTDGEQQSKVYGTAEATVKDVVTFCDRNPDTCTTGRDAFEVLVHKAEFGARMLMGFIKEQTGTGEASSDASASDEFGFLGCFARFGERSRARELGQRLLARHAQPRGP